MIQVYFSHVGENPLIGVNAPESYNAGTIRAILTEIETRYPGLTNEVLDEVKERINSATLLFKNIEVDSDGRLLETERTQSIRSLDEKIAEEDVNLLIAIFHPEHIVDFIFDTLTRTDQRFFYYDGNKEYRSYISKREDNEENKLLYAKAPPEALYSFTNGRPMSQLVTEDLIDVTKDKLIPRSLQNAIATLWEIQTDSSLRLFQEDALKHILHELSRAQDTDKQPLLLSIPTGGGKTEAFLIPLIAHLHNQRERQLRAGSLPQPAVRSIVIYPTRALANDQAKRIAEILYQMNKDAVEDRKISVGVLTGDTTYSSKDLQTDKSLLQLCPRCSTVLTEFSEPLSRDNNKPVAIARCICGAEIDFFRLSRQDILSQPPDILITSPDMINYMLQSPRYQQKIFSSAIDIVVFDEIHMYSSVFGCNVAHLLRRFEEVCTRKPLYVGVSATIRNAKELACLVFDADLKSVRYLRPQRKDEIGTNDDEKRPYLDYQSPPSRYRYHYALTPARLASSKVAKGRKQKVTTSVLNVADVIGHLLRDPHFRKTLIFANFRQDTDDIVRFLRDQEDRYYSTYRRDILPRLEAMRGATGSTQNITFTSAEVDVISAVDRWYQGAQSQGMLHSSNLEIGWHRGGLERKERIKAVNRFTATGRLNAADVNNSELPIDLMVATSTLELGIDIGDVTTVINSGAPFTTNEYVQRVGRGGRRKDAMALTVIDTRNPLDYYFIKHFNRYVHPSADDFEDAPIIVSNKEVIKTHIYARLLDALARYLKDTNKTEMQASDLRDLSISVQGTLVSFRNNPSAFSQALFNELFPPTTIQRLQLWIEREASIIPDITTTTITEEEIWSLWDEKCKQLYTRICDSDEDIRETDFISGMSAKDHELVPDLRSSGPGVGMYLIREGGDDELRDTISRRQAISTRPVGGYASQGSVTFKIESIKEEDPDTEARIKEVFLLSQEGGKATAYFNRMFGDATNRSPFPSDPRKAVIKIHLKTPRDLAVKYSPYRFYCPNCGATYSHKQAGDDRCTYCFHELRQLTEIYMCGGCGKIYTPPVPKVCFNPDCIEQAKSRRDQTPFLPDGYKRVNKRDQHNEFFRFSALPSLNWKCRACGTEVNYHAPFILAANIRRRVENAQFGMNTPEQAAKSFLYKPESYLGPNLYKQEGFLPAQVTCPQCRSENKYKKTSVKNIPSFRSILHEYIIQEDKIAPELTAAAARLHFTHVNIIALAHEHFRRFFAPRENEMQVTSEAIFSDPNTYLANMYSTHATFFQFTNVLDDFLSTTIASECLSGSVCACKTRNQQSLQEGEYGPEDGDNTEPTPYLLDWERERKPDPRRKWCDVVLGQEVDKTCPGPDISCKDCTKHYFNPVQHQRYLILHTLEHAIITTMPKYTGINKNQVRGTLFPNDEREYDLVLVDTIEGGSGSMYLLRKNWSQIWNVVGEILESAQDERDQLVLPYTCSRYNRDLCPHLAYEFYKYVKAREQ